MSQLGVPEQRRVLPATEVMVNGPDDVYVERKGRIEWVGDGSVEGGLSRLGIGSRLTQVSAEGLPGRDVMISVALYVGHSPGYPPNAGYESGFKAGKAEGYDAGVKAGKKKGYKTGVEAGKYGGYNDGWTEGCVAVFDELGSARVYDNFGYYFVTKSYCGGSYTVGD